jgi:hypothetical protein
MPGLVPGIHVFLLYQKSKTWMAGTSPAMTVRAARHCHGMRTQFKPETVIPGRAKREPGIHNHRIHVQR